jgi:acyl transferase domain-containing protein
MSDAVRDQDTIRAVVRSTASNQDGRSPGVTQPTKKVQVELIRAAYENAGLSLGSTRYFEAHGTGTPVGDPIEASAISEVFTRYRSPDDPIYIDAVKSNIGHLEGAAGIAGLLKSVFVLERGIIPPNIWFEKPNPKIPAEEWNFKFPTAATVWPNEGLRRASINSFGYGGSNAHVIMEDTFHYLSMHNLNGRHQTIVHPKLALGIANDSVDEEGTEADLEQKAKGHLATASRPIGAVAVTEPINGLDDLPKTGRKDDASDLLKYSHNTTQGNGVNNESHLRNDHPQIPKVNGTSFANRSHTTNEVQLIQLNYGGRHGQSTEPRDRVFLLSSHDGDGIQRLVQLYHSHLVAKSPAMNDEQSYLDDLSYTLAYRRSALTWRVFVVANSFSSLVENLETPPKPIRFGINVSLAFVFTG